MIFKINKSVLAYIRAAAKTANRDECMGLLASPQDGEAITVAYLLRATASAAHAEADPLVIKECTEDLLARKLVPRGLWHSHANFGVFHSATDCATVNRLLPAMAAWRFERPRIATRAPMVTAPDETVLPMADGRIQIFSLRGAPIPGMDAYERVAWNSIATRFQKTPEPGAILKATYLTLAADGVVIDLDIPEGASVICRTEDPTYGKMAQVYSLVVNNKGHTCADCLAIYELNGECFTRQKSCQVEVIEDNRQDTRAQGFLRLGEGASYPVALVNRRGSV